MNDLISTILEHHKILSVIKGNDTDMLWHYLLKKDSREGRNHGEILRLTIVLINSIIENPEQSDDVIESIAYKLLRSIDIENPQMNSAFSEIMGMDNVDNGYLYYFYLSILSLKSSKTINIRIDLQGFKQKTIFGDNWESRVLNFAMEAFILLVRKSNGYSDIREALLIINKLQEEQSLFENQYLECYSESDRIHKAYVLVGLYHLSKAIVETANYLVEGYSYKKRIDAVIRQHLNTAKKSVVSNGQLQNILIFFEIGLNIIAQNAIWTNTKFNDKIKLLCKKKADSNILELLPSQTDALSKNLLDVASNAIILQMPTSAGKTLLAEFNILVTKALRADAKIVYIVPSRALVNQVYHDLKSDLTDLNLVIEKTSSAIDIDPTEDSFLAGESNIDILVSTPEKLDLLIKRNHPTVDDVSLFIVDEAHFLQNGERGAKLELLLAILQRERHNAKYMLLSPFIKKDQGETLSKWLGGGNSISVDWKPSEKILLGIECKKVCKKNGGYQKFNFLVLDSPLTSSCVNEEIISPYELSSSGEKNKILEFSIKHFGERNKTFLTLCAGHTTTNNRANFIYERTEDVQDDEIRLISKYIDEEVGQATQLSKLLKRGIATHHAGLSDETKLLVEHLIRERKIQYVCATTTIAEGVNFPVSTVFFDSYKRGYSYLSSNDFWNIAGRAGRTLIDNYGKIILPYNSITNRNIAEKLIKKGTNEIVSVLAELFDKADIIEQILKEENALYQLQESYPNSISPLIQYFVHLIIVGGNQQYAAELEDLFKDSLEYYLLDTPDKKERFISICRSLYTHLSKKYTTQKGALSFSDKTGFSVPSVLRVMSECAEQPSIKDLTSWHKDAIFNRVNPKNLAEKIAVIAKLKETKIGSDSDKAPFNPEVMAKLIISWVKGDDFKTIAMNHPHYAPTLNQGENEKKINQFVTKMNEIKFKSSWGLSALEGIVRGDESIKDSHIPSLVYYGVDSEKALAMRMLGIPRSLAFSLGEIIEGDLSKNSFSSIRTKLKGLSVADWENFKPRNSSLSGDEWKRLTEILVK